MKARFAVSRWTSELPDWFGQSPVSLQQDAILRTLVSAKQAGIRGRLMHPTDA